MKRKPKETKKNPVFRTAKSILKLLQNKVIASLMLLGQGVLFLASPSGDMKPTIRISAGLIILVALIMLFLHLRHPQKRNVLDIVIAVFNGLLIPAAIYCLISPETIEPFVRFAVGIVTIVTGLLNLIETLKIGVVMTAAGVEDVAVTQRVIGIFLALNGLANIWYIVQLHRKIKEDRKAQKDKPIPET